MGNWFTQVNPEAEIKQAEPWLEIHYLKKYLHETAQFKDLKVTLDTAQQMSEEQVLEKVKEHFNA